MKLPLFALTFLAALPMLAFAAAPSNDNFGSPEIISDDLGATTGTTAEATKQTGEPSHGGVGGRSVWYKWTAPGTGSVTFDTGGSDIDTLLAAYSGSTLAGLTQLSANDDTSFDTSSAVTFAVTNGATYYIAVDGKAAEEGDFALSWSFFAGDSVLFEPALVSKAENAGPATLTLKRVGPRTGTVVVEVTTTDGSATDPDDYTGIDQFITFTAGQSTKTVSIPLINDTESEDDETIFVDVFIDSTSGGAEAQAGGTSATVTIVDDDDPANDDFANAQLLTGTSGTVTGTTLGADSETGEPVVGAGSIWYKFVAPSNGVATFDCTQSAAVPLAVYVYTGTALNNLAQAAYDEEGKASVNMSSGTTYYIALADPSFEGTQDDTSLEYHFVAGGSVIRLENSAYSVREKNTAGLDLTLLRSTTDATSSATVHVTTVNGTAVSGSDYAVLSANVTFAASELQKIVHLTVNNDGATEAPETLTVQLDTPGANVLLGDPAAAEVTIIDDDDDPANNDFANAIAISGVSGTTNGTTAGADREIENNEVATAPGEHSVWYSWIAPQGGVAMFTVAGTGYTANVGAYTGSNVGNLTRLDQGGLASVSFTAIAGTTYYLAVDTTASSTGTFNLNWSYAPGGLIEFSAANYSVDETDGTVQVGIHRSGGTGAASVTFTTATGNFVTATAGDIDYTDKTVTVNFAPNETDQFVSVAIVDDTENEGDEYFDMTLSSPSNGAAVGRSLAYVTIVDDDDDPANDDFSAAETITGVAGSTTGTTLGADRESGEPLHATGAAHSVWYSWTAPSSGTVTFNTAGSGFSAICAAYTGTSVGNLTSVAAAGSSTSFAAVKNTTYTIAVDGANGSAGSLALAWNIAGLQPGTIAFQTTNIPVTESVGSATLTLLRTGGSDGEVTVDIVAYGGTATPFEDYTPVATTITFADGETSKSVDVAIADDNDLERSETILADLSNPVGGAQLGTASSAVITILSNDGFTPGYRPAAAAFRGLINYGDDFAATGSFAINVTATRKVTASVILGGQKFAFIGNVNTSGHFSKDINVAGLGTVHLDFDILSGQLLFSSVSVNGGAAVTFDGQRAYYNASRKAPQAGKFTALLDAPVPNPANPQAGFPQAPGFFTMTVSKTGAVKTAGRLADGTPFSAGSLLDQKNRFGLYSVLYAKQGGVAVSMKFGTNAAADGTFNVHKPNRPNDTLYPAGFDVDGVAEAQRYLPPKPNHRVLATLDASSGSGLITFDAFDLPDPDPTVSVNVSKLNLIHIKAGGDPANTKLSLTVNPANGLLNGSFRSTFGGLFTSAIKVPLHGVIYTRDTEGIGSFNGPSESGTFTLKATP